MTPICLECYRSVLPADARIAFVVVVLALAYLLWQLRRATKP